MHNKNHLEINAYKLKLRSITENDLEQLLLWRNSPEIRNNMLSQDIISMHEQKKWFDTLSNEDALDFHFFVEYKDNPIGYANFKPAKGVDNGQTGLYIGNKKYRGTVLAYCLALALLDFVFLELGENEIDAVVLDHNTAAIRFNEKLGYRIFLSDGLIKETGLIKMHLSQAHYLLAKSELKKIIRV